MTKSIVWTIVRVFFTFIWRVALTAAVIAALCIAGLAMVLNMVFNGPSESARDALTLTLSESVHTARIPSLFLDDETAAEIYATVNAPTGLCSTDSILVGTESEQDWAQFPTGVRTESVTAETYTATIKLLRSSAGIRFSHNSQITGPAIIASDIHNGVNYAGFLETGELIISSDYLDLVGMDPSSVLRCGPVLVRDGQINETLYAAPSGYAPRAAIGQRCDGTLILVTTDGWNSTHIGAVYQDLINIMTEYGAVNACVLHRDAAANEE